MVIQMFRDISGLSPLNRIVFYLPTLVFLGEVIARRYFCVLTSYGEDAGYIATFLVSAIVAMVIRANDEDTLKIASCKTFGFGTYYFSILAFLLVATAIFVAVAGILLMLILPVLFEQCA
jgi:hypothetical protein